ncbi:uncharacterized protein LOC131153429 [Malania oleifera]|uniref:uncharacterized protein LOC131153429 n=1 Tax=Malania oleifera TaxID=397392 RepID=UPI0025ADB1DB|nr:uncharacterized protein LOC131153429 [Malania oleifera]
MIPKGRLPIFRKVSNFMKFSILMAKMSKPIVPDLCFLKKSRRAKKFNLLKHYNYRFLQEYQFSPSNGTPLFQHRRKALIKKRNGKDSHSLFFGLSRCLGGSRAEWGDGDCTLELDTAVLPAIEDGAVNFAGEYSPVPLDSGFEEEDSNVDQRAERFIERFYEEMRKQSRESVLQLMTVE